MLAPISSTRTAATIESSHIATNCTNQRTGVAIMLLKPNTMGGRLFDGGMFRDCSDERDHFEDDMNWRRCYLEKLLLFQIEIVL